MGKAGRERHDAAGSVKKPVNILTPVHQRVKTPVKNQVLSPHQTPPFAHGHVVWCMNDAVGNIRATVVNVHGEKLKGKFDNATVAGYQVKPFYVMRIADENGRNNIANKVNKTRHDRPPEGNPKRKKMLFHAAARGGCGSFPFVFYGMA